MELKDNMEIVKAVIEIVTPIIEIVTPIIVIVYMAVFGQQRMSDVRDEPNVCFIRLPGLRHRDEYVHKVILHNRGKKVARDVVLKVRCNDSAEITWIEPEGDSFLSYPTIPAGGPDGGIKENHFTLRIDELLPKVNGAVYFTIKHDTHQPEVTVMYGDKVARQENYPYRRSQRDTIIIRIALFVLCWTFLSGLSRIFL